MSIKNAIGNLVFVGGLVVIAAAVKSDTVKSAVKSVSDAFMEGFNEGYEEATTKRLARKEKRAA